MIIQKYVMITGSNKNISNKYSKTSWKAICITENTVTAIAISGTEKEINHIIILNRHPL